MLTLSQQIAHETIKQKKETEEKLTASNKKIEELQATISKLTEGKSNVNENMNNGQQAKGNEYTGKLCGFRPYSSTDHFFSEFEQEGSKKKKP